MPERAKKIRQAFLKLREKRGLFNSENLSVVHRNLTGDARNIRGDASKIWGNCSKLKGNVSELKGCVDDMEGEVPNLSSFELQQLANQHRIRKKRIAS